MRRTRALTPMIALAAAWTAAAPARANGRFPAAQHVLIGPGAERRVIALRATFGFVVSDDGGATFHYICEEALNYGTRNYDPPFALDRSGRLHAGLVDGTTRVSADRCRYESNAVFDGLLVTDMDNDPAGTSVVALGAPAAPASRNRVYRSDDGGDSFAPLGDGVTGLTFDTLEMAPSNTQRVYLSGLTFSPRRPVFYRSDDGGTTLREMPFTAGESLEGAYIAAVDPVDPDRVFVRGVLVPTFGDGGTLRGTALLRTTDGGQTWSEVARSRGSMLGFALSDDGRTAWYGGPNAADGLQRSEDGGDSWRRVGSVEVLCLRQHAGVLYVCANHLTAGYALGRSRDRGDSIEPLVRFADVRGAFACPPGSPESDLCGPRWNTLYMQYFADESLDAGAIDAAPRDAALDGTSPADARGAAEIAASQRHCGCRAPGSKPGRPGAVALTLALGILRRRPRRSDARTRVR